ncbi:hypothetical protein ACFRAQ_34545 [Nocardia sp. NPDC056611]|uniref:hypothetical protein n=1 Tax=Nocardia sp. NPDC056611 TaxID=3345877 RepID=UPI00366E9EA2
MSSTAEEAAAAAYSAAAAIDRRIPAATKDRVAAWAALFAGTDVEPDEAVEAVQQYYRDASNMYSIMPARVLAAVAELPPNHSEARLKAFIRLWAEYPYSGQIQRLTGMDWTPTLPLPEGIHGNTAKERAYHVDELKAWVRDNWAEMKRRVLNA